MIDIEDILKQTVLNRKMGLITESPRETGLATYTYTATGNGAISECAIDVFDGRRGFILEHDPAKRIQKAEATGVVLTIPVSTKLVPIAESGTIEIVGSGEAKLTYVPSSTAEKDVLDLLSLGEDPDQIAENSQECPNASVICEKYKTGQMSGDGSQAILWFCPTLIDVIKLANAANVESLPTEICRTLVKRDDNDQALREGIKLYNDVKFSRVAAHGNDPFYIAREKRWKRFLKEPECGAGGGDGTWPLTPGSGAKGLGDRVFDFRSINPELHDTRGQDVVITEFGIFVAYTDGGTVSTAMYIPPERVIQELTPDPVDIRVPSSADVSSVPVSLLYRCIQNIETKNLAMNDTQMQSNPATRRWF